MTIENNYFVEKCDAEYGSNKNIKKEDIEQIKNWVDKESHLPNIDQYLIIQFYSSSDYSIQRTKNLIDLHYSFRNEAPEFFTGRGYEPPKFSHTFWDITYMFDMPHHTEQGYRLVYCGFKDPTASKFHLEYALAMFVKGLLIIINKRGSCEGYSFVFDMQGTTIGHLATVTISLLRKFLFFAQEAVPLKVREVNVINANSLIEKIMFLIKPFLSKELMNMITIDSDMNNFFKRIPKELIPEDLGGSLPQTREQLTEEMMKEVTISEEIIDAELALRSLKMKNNNSCNRGLDKMRGSFKKLDLD